MWPFLGNALQGDVRGNGGVCSKSGEVQPGSGQSEKKFGVGGPEFYSTSRDDAQNKVRRIPHPQENPPQNPKHTNKTPPPKPPTKKTPPPPPPTPQPTHKQPPPTKNTHSHTPPKKNTAWKMGPSSLIRAACLGRLSCLKPNFTVMQISEKYLSNLGVWESWTKVTVKRNGAQ